MDAGLRAVDGEDAQHVLARDGSTSSGASLPITRQQRAAGGVLVDPGVLEQQLQVHVEDARGAVAALDVAPDPEQARAMRLSIGCHPLCCGLLAGLLLLLLLLVAVRGPSCVGVVGRDGRRG